MKIVITNSATLQTATLAAGGAQSPLDDLDLAHTGEIQEVAYIRADSVQELDRKLARFDQTFTVLYQMNSIGQAEQKALNLGITTPRWGNVTFTTEPDSSGSQQFFLKNASCQVVSAKQIGSSILATYRLRGGKISRAS